MVANLIETKGGGTNKIVKNNFQYKKIKEMIHEKGKPKKWKWLGT